MQTVGKFDQDYADVPGHRQEHLAEVLRLALLAGLESDFADLGDTIDHLENFFAEQIVQFFFSRESVFEGIVEETRDNSRHIHTQARQDECHLHRM